MGEVEPLMCVVCMAEPITHVIVPCGHHCVCEDCSTRLREAQMPCKEPFTMRRVEPFTIAMRVYAAGCRVITSAVFFSVLRRPVFAFLFASHIVSHIIPN